MAKLEQCLWCKKSFKPKESRVYCSPGCACERHEYYLNKRNKEVGPGLVTWYRPRIVWCQWETGPRLYQGVHFKKDKLCHVPHDVKVLEWEEIKLPTSFDKCEEGENG